MPEAGEATATDVTRPYARVLGIDPGEMTGWCFVRRQGDKVCALDWGEILLDVRGDSHLRLLTYLKSRRPDLVAMESVVLQGQVSNDKFNQIRAYERAMLAAAYSKTPVKLITPSQRSALQKQIKVPKDVKGDHARDAYRLAVVCMIAMGVLTVGNPESETDQDR